MHSNRHQSPMLLTARNKNADEDEITHDSASISSMLSYVSSQQAHKTTQAELSDVVRKLK